MSGKLTAEHAWAIYIDNDTLTVAWHTDNLPASIPQQYTISDIADLTRGYLEDYPTYTGRAENGLVVVGYPKDRYWKHMFPSWDYDFIKNLPYLVLIVIGVNVFLIFLIYMIANSKLLKSVRPITDGIQALPSGEPFMSEKPAFCPACPPESIRPPTCFRARNGICREKRRRGQTGFPAYPTTSARLFPWSWGMASQMEDDEASGKRKKKGGE